MQITLRCALAAALLLGCVPADAIDGKLSEPIRFEGTCDASAAVALGKTMFVVGDDENNVLRVYRNDTPGKPLAEHDVSKFTRVAKPYPEIDIEGAATIGERTYWIGSHSTPTGTAAMNRRKLFATRQRETADGFEFSEVGEPYERLLDDLLADWRYAPYKLSEGVKTPAKAPGALNIEGLSATPEGTLLLGFRGPIVDGKALLIELTNPVETITGKRAKLGNPLAVDLGGRGIRDIEYWPERKEYLIVAGPIESKRDFKLYRFAADRKQPPEEIKVDLGTLNLEAVVMYPGDAKRCQLISDDGGTQIEGHACNAAETPVAKRGFRGVFLTLD